MGNALIFSLLLIVGIFIGAVIAFIITALKKKNEEHKASNIIEKAKKDAEKSKRDALLEAKEESYKLKLETEKEIKEKKQDLKENEERLIKREDGIAKRDELLQNREQMLDEKENGIIQKQKDIQKLEEKVENIIKEQIDKLEKISGFSKKKAKEEIMKQVELSMSAEISAYIKEKEAEAKLEVDKKAKNLLAESMQKYASDVTNEQTVSVVTLPNNDMKGRIIGREGRNIRTIEAVTGVDLIIDDTPEAIVLSSFDPLRREIARQTIETLIKDGRIHPARIEELYGEEAMFELGITKLDPELVTIVGKLNFRTSYGQNALQHSKEVAHLAGIMAAELGENVALAKRAGLLHDIGKAIDFEVEGSHVEIGADLAKKYGEDSIVINAIESHHGDKDANNIISVLVAIADSLSAARPGVRNDSLENYVKRLEQLESIAKDFDGVEKAYAMQAGRELRVIVEPSKVDDIGSYKTARDIKTRIENEMQYPGTVKVTVIRETRATEEAK